MVLRKIISSESVTEGHPDKICDQISDAILDAILKDDPDAHVACECFVTTGLVLVGGEITTSKVCTVEYEKIIRDIIKEIGYNDSSIGFDYRGCAIINTVHSQSEDIAQGVKKDMVEEQGAGDQGIMYGYATKETPEFMPLPIVLAHKITMKLTEVRKNGTLPFLRPDGKSLVAVEYENDKPIRIEAIVIAAQHAEEATNEEIESGLKKEVIEAVIPTYLVDEKTKIFINRTGRFVTGGPHGDSGLTGRKIIVDTYGGVDSHGGGAFCVAGSSLINYENGIATISELDGIEEGTLIKTDISPSPIKRWIDNGKMKTLIVETKEGYKLEGSFNQNIRIIDKNGNYVWRRLDTLQTDDWIAIQRKNRLFGKNSTINFEFQHKEGTRRFNEFKFPNTLTEEYGYLLGLLIGDGLCTSRNGIQICVWEDEMKNSVQNLYEQLFGDKGKIFGHWAHYCGVELREFLYTLGLDYSRSWEKSVPNSIFKAQKSVIASFIRGLFDTDGTIRKTGRNLNSIEITLTSTSKQLIEETQQLLLNFGIISSIQEVGARGLKSEIDGRIVESKRIRYHLRIKGTNSITAFKKEINFGLTRKSRVLNSVDFSNKRNLWRIPNQKSRLKRLWDKLSPKEHQEDKAKIGRLLRSQSYKGTKELTYTKLVEFLDCYKNRFDDDPDFEYLKSYYILNHYYSELKSITENENHVYDFEVPGVHSFTANGFICHNSGKDPSKVDRSASYAARYVAKNVVAAELADKCEVQVSYAIGEPKPLAVNIECFGTEKVSIEILKEAILCVFDFRPGNIIEYLKLKRPIYQKTSCYGHFGRELPDFTWEKTDLVEKLRAKVDELK